MKSNGIAFALKVIAVVEAASGLLCWFIFAAEESGVVGFFIFFAALLSAVFIYAFGEVLSLLQQQANTAAEIKNRLEAPTERAASPAPAPAAQGAQTQAPPARQVAVVNYALSRSPRPCLVTLHPQGQGLAFTVDFFFYDKATPAQFALLDIAVFDVFGGAVRLEGVVARLLAKEGGVFTTETLPLTPAAIPADAFSHAEVALRKLAAGGRAAPVEDRLVSSTLSPAKLMEVKRVCGMDAVADFKPDTTPWLCCCGNGNTGQTCGLCGREKPASVDAMSWDAFLAAAGGCASCKEVLALFNERGYPKDTGTGKQIYEELERAMEVERIYGDSYYQKTALKNIADILRENAAPRT